MKEIRFREKNHYVPCMYLRGFAGPDERIYSYRTLVSDPGVPLWKPSSASGVGYHTHLYTAIIAGAQTDEFEKWLGLEVETPAAEPLRIATSEGNLTPQDWERLIRFLAAQIVRTPAHFVKNVSQWQEDTPKMLNEVLEGAVGKLKAAKLSGTQVRMPNAPHTEYLPVRVKTEQDPDSGTAKISAEAVVGRGFWLFSIKTALTKTQRVLQEQHWTILSPAEGPGWFTSDDPVVRLNYYSPDKYNFDGGWGQKGVEIFMPLSPRHLLYTMVGHRPLRRGTVLSPIETQRVRRVLAEHAHRLILATSPDEDIVTLRPRIADREIFRNEQEQWRSWHMDQTTAEHSLLSPGSES